MPWLKTGDQFATHPLLTSLYGARGGDERTVNEVAGFIMRCAAQSAGHMTDYVIDYGTAVMLGGGRHELLMRQATEAGLVAVSGRGATRRWKIVQDPDFLHIRPREDVEWERQRKRDLTNPDLTMPVRLRDGDECRYCGVVVSWGDRKSGRGGTYDHINAGQSASTPDELVVCCRACNSARRDRDHADEIRPLRPAPSRPHFSPSGRRTSLEILREHYAPWPTHWIHAYTNPAHHHPSPAAESTAGDMEDHAQTESTCRTAEAYAPNRTNQTTTWEARGAAESTAPEWARPEQSPAGHLGGEEAHGTPTPPAPSGPSRGEVRPYPVAEAHLGAGSTVAVEEAHDGLRKAAVRRRKRRQRGDSD